MKKVLVLGGVSYDSIIRVKELLEAKPKTVFPDDFYESVGGTGAGKAFNLNQLGFDVIFHGIIGNDFYGKIIEEAIAKSGVNFIKDISAVGTERHTNFISDKGERISLYTVYDGNPVVTHLDEIEAHIKEADYIWLNIIDYCRVFMPLIEKYNKKVWVDIHDYNEGNPYHQAFIDIADYLFMSSDNLPSYETFMSKMIDQGKEVVVCTHGRDGSTIMNKNKEIINIPIVEKFEFVDSNGAGDAFTAGFMLGFDNNYDLTKCAMYGTIAAGMAIESRQLYNENLSIKEIESVFSCLNL